MGQRCFILVKKNYKGNKSTIDLIHHQWGVGKTLGALFLQELLRTSYNLDRRMEWKSEYIPTIEHFTFNPLSNKSDNYIYNQEVNTSDSKYDVWNSKARMELCNITDNNNGGMVIEVTQKYKDEGKPITYGDCMDVKIGFCLGNEETDFSHRKISGYIAIEEPYERIVSLQEFMSRTWETGNEDGSNEMFNQSFQNLCELFGVEQVVEKEKAKEVEEKWLRVTTLAETFTKDVADGQCIDIPKELRNPTLIYN